MIGAYANSVWNKKTPRSTKRLKELCQQGFAVRLQNAAPNLDAVEKALIGEIHPRTTAARDFIKRAKHDALELCVDAGARAHGAGLKRDIERAVAYTATMLCHSFTQAEELRVRGCVAGLFYEIVRAGDHLAIADQYRADGDLARFRGELRLLQR